MNIDSKLSKVVSKQFMNELADIAIYREVDGSYHLFNKYCIRKQGEGYTVTNNCGDIAHTFYNLKNAASWCIFDKRDNFYKSRRMIELDRRLSGTEVDILVQEQIFKKAKNSDETLICLAKLNEAKLKRKDVLEELSEYVNETTVWQNKRFAIKA